MSDETQSKWLRPMRTWTEEELHAAEEECSEYRWANIRREVEKELARREVVASGRKERP